MPDASRGRTERPAASLPPAGTGAAALTGSPRLRCLLPTSAMRWLWPLALSLAVAAASAASGPSWGPGGPPLPPGSRPRRGAENEEARGVQTYVPEAWAQFPRPHRPPAGPQPTGPGVAAATSPGDAGGAGDPPTGVPGRRLRLRNPLYPVTERSPGAYAVLLLALAVLAVGVVANLAVMCVVGHSRGLQSAWYAILASLALWDFLVLVLCLPVVVFHALAQRRLLGAASCRAVPFLEVSALGVTTFSLCALGIDRFHVATSTLPTPRPAERCRSILAKLAVIWVGSVTLAAPELLLWQLAQEPATGPGATAPGATAGGDAVDAVDACVMRPSPGLPESLYSLVLTYQHARTWWGFGCYFCLPVLFAAACQLVTWRVRGGAPGRGGRRPPVAAAAESRPSATVVGLTAVYALCTLPQHVAGLVGAYLAAELGRPTLALLDLVAQFSAFFQGALAPALLLCVSRPLGLAFRDCCCCCCGEEACGGSVATGSHGTTATAAAAAKLKTEMAAASPGYFHKPRGSPSLLPPPPLGTPC